MGTVDGKYGPGWQESWGTFAKWANQNVDATKACCACGGGFSSVKSSEKKTGSLIQDVLNQDVLNPGVLRKQNEAYPTTKKLSQKQTNSSKGDSNVIHVDIMLHDNKSTLTTSSLKKIFSKIMNIQSDEMKVFIEPKKLVGGNSSQHVQVYLEKPSDISSTRLPKAKSVFNDNLLQSFIEAGFSVSDVATNSPASINRRKKNWQHDRRRNRPTGYQLNPLH